MEEKKKNTKMFIMGDKLRVHNFHSNVCVCDYDYDCGCKLQSVKMTKGEHLKFSYFHILYIECGKSAIKPKKCRQTRYFFFGIHVAFVCLFIPATEELRKKKQNGYLHKGADEFIALMEKIMILILI